MQEPKLSPARPPWPTPLAAKAFHGLAGEFILAVTPHSEADPAALLIQFLVCIGSVIGRGPHFIVEQMPHHLNLFSVIVGETSKARKGSSFSQVRALLSSVDAAWAETRILGGVGSGEGIIWNLRDAVRKGDELVDEGVQDKRLLVMEEEFAQILAVAERQGATVSEVLRRGWDGTTLQTLTKNNPTRATDALVSVIGHITKPELLRRLSETEIANGLANRFIFCCARRSNILPDGGALNWADHSQFVEKLREAVNFARDVGEIKRDSGARGSWHKVYKPLSDGKPGLFGSIVSRGEAHVLRLSMLYALLDCSNEIRREHLEAALAVWRYAEESCRHIFGDALGDPVADEILRALRRTEEGLTRSEIHGLFGRNRQEAEISPALAALAEHGLAHFVTESTRGRSAER
jgi:hypothetical protein